VIISLSDYGIMEHYGTLRKRESFVLKCNEIEIANQSHTWS